MMQAGARCPTQRHYSRSLTSSSGRTTRHGAPSWLAHATRRNRPERPSPGLGSGLPFHEDDVEEEEQFMEAYRDLMDSTADGQPAVIRVQEMASASQRARAQEEEAAARMEARQMAGLMSVTAMRALAESDVRQAAEELRQLQQEGGDPQLLALQLAQEGYDLDADWAAFEGVKTTTGASRMHPIKGPSGEVLMRPPSNPKIEAQRREEREARRRRRLFSNPDAPSLSDSGSDTDSDTEIPSLRAAETRVQKAGRALSSLNGGLGRTQGLRGGGDLDDDIAALEQADRHAAKSRLSDGLDMADALIRRLKQASVLPDLQRRPESRTAKPRPVHVDSGDEQLDETVAFLEKLGYSSGRVSNTPSTDFNLQVAPVPSLSSRPTRASLPSMGKERPTSNPPPNAASASAQGQPHRQAGAKPAAPQKSQLDELDDLLAMAFAAQRTKVDQPSLRPKPGALRDSPSELPPSHSTPSAALQHSVSSSRSSDDDFEAAYAAALRKAEMKRQPAGPATLQGPPQPPALAPAPAARPPGALNAPAKPSKVATQGSKAAPSPPTWLEDALHWARGGSGASGSPSSAKPSQAAPLQVNKPHVPQLPARPSAQPSQAPRAQAPAALNKSQPSGILSRAQLSQAPRAEASAATSRGQPPSTPSRAPPSPLLKPSLRGGPAARSRASAQPVADGGKESGFKHPRGQRQQ